MSYLPTDIAFSRVGNQITGTVTLNAANPTGPVLLSITYSPLSDVTTHDNSCTVPQNSLTGTFHFTLASNATGILTVTAAPVGNNDPNDWCVAHYPIP